MRYDVRMPTLAETVEILEQFAPLALAEEWDNVGLLVGDRGRSIQRLMTCLTITPTTVDEAVRERADLVVVHHPLPFRPLSRITSDTTVGRMLLALDVPLLRPWVSNLLIRARRRIDVWRHRGATE